MSLREDDPTWLRLIAASVIGVAAGLATAAIGRLALAPMGGWVAAAAVFCLWTWLNVAHMDADQTSSHALREDPGQTVGDVALLVASVGALVGVGLLLAAGSNKATQGNLQAVVGVAGVAASWFTVHTLFALRYARLYYNSDDRPIDFNDPEPPTYGDFAYLAFTIGMTYQVSDTNLRSKSVRHTALRHALLSFVLGSVILACTVNLIVQLASSGG